MRKYTFAYKLSDSDPWQATVLAPDTLSVALQEAIDLFRISAENGIYLAIRMMKLDD